jgi:glucosyl-dolichyl phosphate glucuronosyltransferase
MTVEMSVIICTYTEARWNDLVAAVRSVSRQDRPACEVIVVVDHNSALLDRVCSDLPEVIGVENAAERGLSGARNSGIAASSGSILAFMDDDATADADWLSRLGAAYKDPFVVGVGGAIEPDWVGGRPFWFPDEFRWVVGCSYRGMPQSVGPVRNLIGCNMSFRREILASVGGFSTGIGRVGTRPVGCEETELCIRVQQHHPGVVMLFEPVARVRHRVPVGRSRWGYFVSRCYSEGLSKALVAQLVGSRDGLSSERSYTMRTLPRGVARGFADAVRGRPSGVARAAAIVAGLACTSAGYAAGRLSRRSVNVRVNGFGT